MTGSVEKMMGKLFVAGEHLETRSCPVCEEGTARLSVETQEFEYGEGDDAVTLEARVPVWTCDACGEQFADWRGEDARHGAVCDHLGRLRPVAVQAIRQRQGLSQEQFATLTGIGIASIKRWESGSLIQGEAFDRYLRLIENPMVFAELQREVFAKSDVREPTFRTQIPLQVREQSRVFVLRPDYPKAA